MQEEQDTSSPTIATNKLNTVPPRCSQLIIFKKTLQSCIYSDLFASRAPWLNLQATTPSTNCITSSMYCKYTIFTLPHLIRLALPCFFSQFLSFGSQCLHLCNDGIGATCPANSDTSQVHHYPANAKKLISRNRLSPLFTEEEFT